MHNVATKFKMLNVVGLDTDMLGGEKAEVAGTDLQLGFLETEARLARLPLVGAPARVAELPPAAAQRAAHGVPAAPARLSCCLAGIQRLPANSLPSE